MERFVTLLKSELLGRWIRLIESRLVLVLVCHERSASNSSIPSVRIEEEEAGDVIKNIEYLTNKEKDPTDREREVNDVPNKVVDNPE